MTDLDTPIEASYNGYVFSVYAETQGIDIASIYDQAGRTVTHKVFTLTIKDILQDDDGVDFLEVRRQLEQPGGDLVYEDAGFGVFTFGFGGLGAKDLKWGPKPRSLGWKQHGAGNAIEFVWKVELATLDHENARDRLAIMEFNYRLAHSFDKSGYCKRTYSGHLIIPQTRQGVDGTELSDSVEAYKNKVWPRLPMGFRRASWEFPMSEDKCRLDFSIIDEELPPNVPPPYCIDANGSHVIESEENNIHMWRGTITCSYELKKGVPGWYAAGHFAALVKDRIDACLANASRVVNIHPVVVNPREPNKHIIAKNVVLGQKVIPAGKGTTVIPLKFTFKEPQIFGKTMAEFSLLYRFNTDIATIFAASGCWRKVPDSDWAKWALSTISAINPRGNAQMKFKNEEDSIIDLRTAQVVKLPGGQAEARTPFALPIRQLFNFTDKNQLTPEQSWMSYTAQLELEILDEIVQIKTLPADQPQPNKERINGPQAINVKANVVPYSPRRGGSVVQERAAPTVIVHFKGNALRAGFEITAPELKKIMGSDAIEVGTPGTGIHQGIVANYGIPVAACEWHRRYILADTPGGEIGVPENFILNNA